MTAKNAGTPARGNGRPARVLVVDDDADIRWALQGVLEDEGLLVDLARDSEEALTRAARHPPALVVLDIQLTDGDAYDVARQLRLRHGSQLPILVMTADGSAARKAREVGAFAYLRKPFDLTHLLDLVHAQVPRG